MLSARKGQTFVPLKACLGKMRFTKILSQQNLKFSLKIFFSFNQMKAFFPFLFKTPFIFNYLLWSKSLTDGKLHNIMSKKIQIQICTKRVYQHEDSEWN